MKLLVALEDELWHMYENNAPFYIKSTLGLKCEGFVAHISIGHYMYTVYNVVNFKSYYIW